VSSALVSPASADLVVGHYPTPVERIEALSRPKSALWVKRDDLTHPLYGGNKVRKLEHLLAEARRRGKTRVLTLGAAGSHHVLATSLFGARAGLAVDAVLVPQRNTGHVVENLRADLAAGATLFPVGSYATVPFGLLRAYRHTSYVIPMGGSNVVGSMGYVDAARELAAQVKAGVLPEPDVAVVTLGSGGTVAGLAAGLALAGLRTRIIAVVVAGPAFVTVAMARWLARRCYARAGGRDAALVRDRIVPTAKYLGRGYGEPTAAGARATEEAKEVGLVLDPTYTAKCFAAAQDVVRSESYANVLYWHTLSSAPMEPLLASAPAADSIDPRLRRLLR